MCYVSKNNIMKKKNVWIEDEIFEKVVDNIKPYSDEDLTIFGNG